MVFCRVFIILRSLRILCYNIYQKGGAAMKIFLAGLAVIMGFVSCAREGDWKVYNSKNTAMAIDAVRQVVIENGKLSWVGTFGNGLYAVKGDQWVKSDRPALSHYIL